VRDVNLLETVRPNGILSHLRKLSLEASLIWSGEIVAALGAIVGVRLLTRCLDPPDYGAVALAMTVATVGQQVIFSPVMQAAVRYLPVSLERKSLPSFLAGLTHLLRTGSAVLGLALGLGVLILALSGQHKTISLGIIAGVFAGICGCNSVMDGVQMAARQRAIVAWHQALSQWLRFSLAAAFVYLFVGGSTAAMAGYTLAALAVLLSQWFFLRRVLDRLLAGNPASSKGNGELTGAMRSYAWPFAMWGLFTWLQMSSDRWSLEAFRSAREVGLFQVSYQLGYYPLQLLSGVSMQLFIPILFKMAGDGSAARRVQLAQRATIGLVGCSLGATLVAGILSLGLGNRLVALVASAPYQSSARLLPLMVFAGGLFGSAQIASLLPMINGASRTLLKPKIGVAVVGVLLNVAGAYWYGLLGVAVSSLLQSLLLLVWMLSIISPHALRGSLPVIAEPCNAGPLLT